MGKGVTLTDENHSGECVGYVLGQSQLANILKSRKSHSTKLLQLLHSDVLGLVEVKSVVADSTLCFYRCPLQMDRRINDATKVGGTGMRQEVQNDGRKPH